MGKQIVYCEVCGERILEADIDAGKAVVVAGRDYCAKCRDKAPKVVAGSVPAGQGHRAVDSTRRLAIHVRPGGSSQHGGSHHGAPPPKNNSLVAGVVIGAILVLLGAFAMMGGSTPEPTPSRASVTPTKSPGPDRAAEAAAAFKRIKDFVADHPDDPDSILARIEAEKEKLIRSIHWDSVELLQQQAMDKRDRRARDKKFEDQLARLVQVENGDPKYGQRHRIHEILAEARTMAAPLGDAAKARVDDAEKAYERRYNDAAKAAALPILSRAGQAFQQNRFDDALAALDEFPSSFEEAAAYNDITRTREQVEQAKAAAERPTPQPQAQNPQWVNDHMRAFKTLQADASETSWREWIPTLEKTLVHLKEYDKVGRVLPNVRLQLGCSSHYLQAMYYAQFKQDNDAALKHLAQAFGIGAAKEAVEAMEKQAFLSNLRKDPRYKALSEKLGKRYCDPARRWLGVAGSPLLDEEMMSVPEAGAEQGAFFVSNFYPNSAAAAAGILLNDVIYSFAGEKLSRTDPYASLDAILEKTKPDTDYVLEIRRFTGPGQSDKKTFTLRWNSP